MGAPSLLISWHRQVQTTTQSNLRLVLALGVCALLFAPAFAKSQVDCKEGAPDCSDNQDEQEAHHTHFKHLLPLDRYDWAGFISIGTFTAIAAGGGIGGGGVLVPLLILVMGFGIKSAIPLSSVTILGGAIFHIVRNMQRRHPSADRPLIDWNFISLMQPMLISGAVLGSFLNKMVPDWLLAVLLFIVLIFTARRTFNNGLKKWAKEHEEIELRESLRQSGANVELEVEPPLVEKTE